MLDEKLTQMITELASVFVANKKGQNSKLHLLLYSVPCCVSESLPVEQVPVLHLLLGGSSWRIVMELYSFGEVMVDYFC